jgi:hypothetical protein
MSKTDFVECDWSDFYPDAQEAMSLNALKPLGKCVIVGVSIDVTTLGTN